MNINELTSSIYGTNIGNIQFTQNSKKITDKDSIPVSDSFADILSSYASSGDIDANEISELVNELEGSSLDIETDSNNITSILTDAHKAKEYLSSQTGRNLIISMVDNQIASIVSSNSNDN